MVKKHLVAWGRILYSMFPMVGDTFYFAGSHTLGDWNLRDWRPAKALSSKTVSVFAQGRWRILRCQLILDCKKDNNKGHMDDIEVIETCISTECLLPGNQKEVSQKWIAELEALWCQTSLEMYLLKSAIILLIIFFSCFLFCQNSLEWCADRPSPQSKRSATQIALMTLTEDCDASL